MYGVNFAGVPEIQEVANYPEIEITPLSKFKFLEILFLLLFVF